jgi:pSer/pThr/pTyr-binding forkhead associated (FHA) protein
LRVEGPAQGNIDIRWPYALIGRASDCDVVLDDPAVASRHVYLHLDPRGLFAIDLASHSGSRIGPEKRLSSWLAPGDAVRIGGWHIVLTALQLDARDPHGHRGADPLVDVVARPLTEVMLYPERSSPLVLHSELVFVGHSRACGIWLDDDAVEPVHGVLIRGERAVYIVDLAGHDVAINSRWLHAPAALRDGDVLTVGRSRLECRIAPPKGPGRLQSLERAGSCNGVPVAAELSSEPVIPGPWSVPRGQEQLVSWLLGLLQATQGELFRRQSDFQREMQQALRRLQNEQASALVRQLEKMEELHREVAGLREEVRRRYTPAELSRRPESPRALLRSPSGQPSPADDGATAAWLMHRIQQINQESRAALRNRRRGK